LLVRSLCWLLLLCIKQLQQNVADFIDGWFAVLMFAGVAAARCVEYDVVLVKKLSCNSPDGRHTDDPFDRPVPAVHNPRATTPPLSVNVSPRCVGEMAAAAVKFSVSVVIPLWVFLGLLHMALMLGHEWQHIYMTYTSVAMVVDCSNSWQRYDTQPVRAR
jgi:hypothetical protein